MIVAVILLAMLSLTLYRRNRGLERRNEELRSKDFCHHEYWMDKQVNVLKCSKCGSGGQLKGTKDLFTEI